MKSKKSKYLVSPHNISVRTFSQFIKMTRRYPDCRILRLVRGRRTGTCVYWEGTFYINNRLFTHKQKKFIKASFKVELPTVKPKYLGVFQRRQAKLKFVKIWSKWSYDRRSHYIQALARQLQRQDLSFGTSTSFQEAIDIICHDLINKGCLNVYI